MAIEIIEIIRNAGYRGLTHVTFTKDGLTYELTVGRHVGERRIKELAETLNLTSKGDAI